MTRLVLEISRKKDLDLVTTFLEGLHIKFQKVETPTLENNELEEAIRIVKKGCNMDSFGDALQYQKETRNDRSLPYRN